MTILRGISLEEIEKEYNNIGKSHNEDDPNLYTVLYLIEMIIKYLKEKDRK